MREYSYTVTEHDPDRPWIVRDCQHKSVQLDDDQSFDSWAIQGWPRGQFMVQLDP